MKSKRTYYLFIVLLLASCDVGSKFYINNQPDITLQGDCGTIQISGFSLGTDEINLKFNGDFLVNLDSLKVLYNWHEVPDIYLYYLHNDRMVSYVCRNLHLEGEEKLRISMRHIVSLNFLKKGTIAFLPSNFILCNGKPVLTDTLRFSIPAKSKKRRK